MGAVDASMFFSILLFWCRVNKHSFSVLVFPVGLDYPRTVTVLAY